MTFLFVLWCRSLPPGEQGNDIVTIWAVFILFAIDLRLAWAFVFGT